MPNRSGGQLGRRLNQWFAPISQPPRIALPTRAGGSAVEESETIPPEDVKEVDPLRQPWHPLRELAEAFETTSVEVLELSPSVLHALKALGLTAVWQLFSQKSEWENELDGRLSYLPKPPVEEEEREELFTFSDAVTAQLGPSGIDELRQQLVSPRLWDDVQARVREKRDRRNQSPDQILK